MRGAAGAGDDAAQAARQCVFGVLEAVVGHPVRGQDASLVRDAERFKLRHCVAHDFPVAVAAHHDAYQRRAFSLCHRVLPDVAVESRGEPAHAPEMSMILAVGGRESVTLLTASPAFATKNG